MSTSYTDVFTGKNITAAFPQYSSIDLTENIILSWPAQFQNTNKVVSVIMDITPDAPGRTVTMPDATEGSVGFAFTVNNPGFSSFQLLDSTGNTIVTAFAGEAYLIWLIDTSSSSGGWRNIPAAGAGGAVTSIDADSDSNNLVVTGTPGLPITAGGTINFSIQRDLLALTQFGASTGFASRIGVDSWALRSILGTASQINVVEGSGVAGSPTISLSPNIIGVSSITLSGLSFGIGASNIIRSTGLNIPIVLSPNGTGVIELSNDSQIKSANRFKFFNATNTNYISFRAGATLVNQDLAWPTSAASPTQVMANDGAGSLYWASVTTYAGASTLNAVARYSNTTGGLKDSPNFVITDAGAATGLISCVVGDIQIATVDSQTIATTGFNQDLVIAPSGLGSLRNKCDVRIESSGGFQKKLRLYNLASNFYAGIQASPTMPANVTWTWPAADGAGIFASDGGGVMSILPLTTYFPGVSTLNAVPRFSNTTGSPLKNSLFVISDTGAATGLLSAVIGEISIATNIITPTTANTDLTLTPTGTGALKSIGELQVLPAAGASKSIKLFNNAGTFFSGLKANNTLVASTTWTLPLADAVGAFTSNGAGVVSITPLNSGFPAASTINAVPRFSNTTGSPLKNSLFVISDTGAATGLTSCTIGSLDITGSSISTTTANTSIEITASGTGTIILEGELQVLPITASEGTIKLFNNAFNFSSGFKASNALVASTIWTLPATDAVGFFSSNGAGIMSISPLTTYFPAASTLNAVPRFSNTTGSPLKNSLFVISDAGAGTGLTSCTIGNVKISTNVIEPTTANTDLVLTAIGTGVLKAIGELQVFPEAGIAKSIKLFNSAGTFFSALKADNALGASTTFTLPTVAASGVMSSNGTGVLTVSTQVTAPGLGKLGIGAATFEATSTNSITFLNGTAAVGAAAPNTLVLQSIPATSTVGTTLAWFGAGSGGIYPSVVNASTHKINIKINGINYYILATTVA